MCWKGKSGIASKCGGQVGGMALKLAGANQALPAANIVVTTTASPPGKVRSLLPLRCSPS